MLDGLGRLGRLGSTPKRLSFMGPSGVDLGMSRHQTKGYPFTNPDKILMPRHQTKRISFIHTVDGLILDTSDRPGPRE
jgi:hypothetical protein